MSTPFGIVCYNLHIINKPDGDFMDNITCYQRIRDLREDADKNQKELADALYMQATQYGRYERGEREIPLGIAISIAKYYNVSLDYVAGLSADKNSDFVRLSDKERRLLENYRALSDFDKGQVSGLAEFLSGAGERQCKKRQKSDNNKP